MRALDIAIFLILLNFSVNFINSSGIFGDEKMGVYYGPDILQTIQSSYAPQQKEDINYVLLGLSTFGFILSSMIVLLFILGYSTILLPVFLLQLGLAAEFNLMLTTMVWVFYIIGYRQFAARMSTEGLA